MVDGEFRNEINTPLVTIADLSRVWATSEVPESKIRYCRVGGTADLELIAYPSETFRARVTRIADTVDSETRTIKVSAELENPGGRLRPEMFGSLHYADGTSAAPWVPEAAVVRIERPGLRVRRTGARTILSDSRGTGQAPRRRILRCQGLKLATGL